MSVIPLVVPSQDLNRGLSSSEDLKVARERERELNLAVTALINEATAFGYRFIKDSNARLRYQKLIEKGAKEILEKVAQGQLTAEAAARAAHAMRNEFLDHIRGISSEIGRALAVRMKKTGLSLDFLLDQKSNRLFGSTFRELSFDSQKKDVFLKVVESAGTANKEVSAIVKFLGKSGRVFLVTTAAFAIYHVCESEDKLGAAAEESLGLTLGSMLSMAGGWAGAFCGPGAVVCVPVGVMIGGALGALGADYAMHWRD
jgi:hypothetical protein